jgi:hypothetical protein
VPLKKAVDSEDCSHDGWGNAPRCCTDETELLSAVQFITESWRLITLTTIKNCFVKCGFSVDHVSRNDDNVMKLSEDEEDDWHSLQPHGVQFEDYTTCDSALGFVESRVSNRY